MDSASGGRRALSHGTGVAEAEAFLSAYFGRDEDQRHPGDYLDDLRVQLAESTPRELAELADAARMLIDEVESEQQRR